MASLPSFFVMQATTGAYMTTVIDHPILKPSGVVKFVEYDAFSPRVKFAAEQSKTGDGSLVHIRSCFNNKYCVAHDVGESSFLIVASANKPQEDATDPACTLFRVETHPTAKETPGFRFFSISKSMYMTGDSLALRDNPLINGKWYYYSFTFPVFDWEELVILPSQVSFKSEDLGTYLCSRFIDGLNYHKFEASEFRDPKLATFELIPGPNGAYHIKSLYFGKCWRANNEWMVADAEDYNYSIKTLFSFIRLPDNVFALRYLGNNKFCGANKKHDFIQARYTDVLSKEAWLRVEERLLNRKITLVKYRLGDSIIHGEKVQEVAHEFVTNESPDNPATATLEVSKTYTTTSSWNNSESVSFGASLSLSFEVNEVPLFASITAGLQLSTEFATSREWGNTNSEETMLKANDAVIVPPKSTVKISLLVTRAVYDVPFDYTERFLLPNGDPASRKKEDGIYKGIKTLDFHLNSKPVEYNPSLGQVFVPGKVISLLKN